jgi:hypothetical protein
MSNINYYIATDRYWETLEPLRDKPDFEVIRRKIDECVVRKSENAIFRSDRDKPFDADPRLKGIWHCKLTSETDAVLFYAIKGDAVVLGFVGSHKDYPFKGANESKVPSLAGRMKRALDAAHVGSPSWGGLHWTIPDDLVHNRRLFELDIHALNSITERLIKERSDAPIFERVHGRSILDKSVTEQDFDAWMTSIDKALAAVRAAGRRVEVGLKKPQEKEAISSVRSSLSDVAESLTLAETCSFVRVVAQTLNSIQGGRRFAVPLGELVEALEVDPYSVDGSRMIFLLSEAERVLSDAGHALHREIAACLSEVRDVVENLSEVMHATAR